MAVMLLVLPSDEWLVLKKFEVGLQRCEMTPQRRIQSFMERLVRPAARLADRGDRPRLRKHKHFVSTRSENLTADFRVVVGDQAGQQLQNVFRGRPPRPT